MKKNIQKLFTEKIFCVEKKRLLFLVTLLMSTMIWAQVGINTDTPNANSDLELGSNNKALLLNRVANTAAVASPVNGMLIYDNSVNCVKAYENNAWSTYLSSGSTSTSPSTGGTGVVSSYGAPACTAGSVSGTMTEGVAVSGVTMTVYANVTTLGTYSITSGPVNGVTFSGSGTFTATGCQAITLTATGTPTAAGTYNYPLSTTPSETVSATVASGAGAGTIASIDCAGATTTGTLTSGTAASGVSSSVPYTGGNGGSYAAQTVTSTGVTGLTAKLAAGSFATGAGNLTYTITGNPASSGTASFAINIGGQSCTLTRTVASPITIPATITLAQNRTYMVASIFDQDYLPYTAPTGPATTNTQAANGSNEAVTVNVQGTITTAGVTIKIPVTATGSNTLPAYSTTITIPSSMTEDGISRDLTLSWAAQAYTSGTTTINATIAAVGGTLNAKKLDINAGIGNDALGVLMGQFTYPYNNAGNTTTYSVRDIAGIPDKMFGLPDNNSNSTTHMMLYLPTVAEDGNIWLNNNLGAYYANINHASFNPAQQATSATDHLAYGSLFQWGRKPDGHELITYTNATTGSAVNGTTSTKSDTPANALFILGPKNPFDWRSSQDDTLWATEASANNPCPVGFRVPTFTEQNTLVTAASITNSASAASSTLKFTVPGYRSSSDGTLDDVGSVGYYWSSSTVGGTGTNAYGRSFTSGNVYNYINDRANGVAVRCLKD